jgi:hypothetical protein
MNPRVFWNYHPLAASSGGRNINGNQSLGFGLGIQEANTPLKIRSKHHYQNEVRDHRLIPYCRFLVR